MQDDRPTYRPGGLQRPDTSFATPNFTQAEYALDANHENTKNFQFRPVQSGPVMRPIETQRADFGQPGQGDQRHQDRPEPDEPDAVQDEPEVIEPAPARSTGQVFGGRDIGENFSDLAMEL